jgi:hypothetical protein
MANVVIGLMPSFKELHSLRNLRYFCLSIHPRNLSHALLNTTQVAPRKSFSPTNPDIPEIRSPEDCERKKSADFQAEAQNQRILVICKLATHPNERSRLANLAASGMFHRAELLVSSLLADSYIPTAPKAAATSEWTRYARLFAAQTECPDRKPG